MRVITLDSNKTIISVKTVGDNYVLEPNDIVSNTGELGQVEQADGTFITPVPPPPTLDDVKNSKKVQIRDSYYQTMAGGFSLAIGTTTYTFGWISDDITHMTATQTAVGKGFLVFPFNYSDINGNPVNIPDQATLDSIESTATKFMMNNHQQSLTLIGQVQSATTVDAVNAISWSPATY